MVEVAGGATLSLVYENLLNEIVPNLTEPPWINPKSCYI